MVKSSLILELAFIVSFLLIGFVIFTLIAVIGGNIAVVELGIVVVVVAIGATLITRRTRSSLQGHSK